MAMRHPSRASSTTAPKLSRVWRNCWVMVPSSPGCASALPPSAMTMVLSCATRPLENEGEMIRPPPRPGKLRRRKRLGPGRPENRVGNPSYNNTKSAFADCEGGHRGEPKPCIHADERRKSRERSEPRPSPAVGRGTAAQRQGEGELLRRELVDAVPVGGGREEGVLATALQVHGRGAVVRVALGEGLEGGEGVAELARAAERQRLGKAGH